MKKLIIVITILFSFLSVQAQENYIISTLYEPDSCFTFQSVNDRLKLDLDQDGVGDAIIYVERHPMGGFMTYLTTTANWKWSTRVGSTYITDSTTIDENLTWRNNPVILDNTATPFPHFAFRHQTDDGIHYGWAYIDCNIYVLPVCISGMGYCKLPDTPIQWGQTEFLHIEENDANAFATLHPNPTTGIVHVEGTKAAEVQVYDVLGQCVKTFQNTNEISLEGLPQGVYLLRVTTEDGDVFSDKVVKE